MDELMETSSVPRTKLHAMYKRPGGYLETFLRPVVDRE